MARARPACEGGLGYPDMAATRCLCTRLPTRSCMQRGSPLVTLVLLLLVTTRVCCAQQADIDEDQEVLDEYIAQLNNSCTAMPEETRSGLITILQQALLYDLITPEPISVLLPILPSSPVLRSFAQEYADSFQVAITLDTPADLPPNASSALGYYYSSPGSSMSSYAARVWTTTDDALVTAATWNIFNLKPVAAYAAGDLESAAALEGETVLPASYMPTELWPSWVALFFNLDMMVRHNLSAPTTWQDLLDLAAQVNGTDLDGDGVPEKGFCLDLAPGCKLQFLLAAIYASMAQAHGTQQGVWFDRVTFQPLFPNPAMAEALRILRQLSSYGTQTCDVLNAEFKQGACLMTLDWTIAHPFTPKAQFANKVLGNVSFARSPGSAVVWAGQDADVRYDPTVPGSGLVTCTAAGQAGASGGPVKNATVCPYARTVPGLHHSQQVVNFANLRESVTFTTTVSTTIDALKQSTTAVFTSWLQDKFRNQYNFVVKNLLGNVYGTNANHSWADPDYNFADILRSGMLWFTDLSPNNYTDAVDIGVPFNQLYRLALDKMAQRAIQQQADDEDDIASIMDQGLSDFAFVQRVFPYNHTLLLYLNATLGVTSGGPRPAPSDAQSARDETSIIVPAVLVPAAVLVLAAVVMLWSSKMRQRHNTLLGRTRPPGVGESTTLVVTDIHSSTILWESLPAGVMDDAMRLHDRCIRDLLKAHLGYESGTEGDMFVCSFHNMAEALAFTMEAQTSLCHLDWPPELLQHSEAGELYVQPRWCDGVSDRSPRGGHSPFPTSHGFSTADLAGHGSRIVSPELDGAHTSGASSAMLALVGGAARSLLRAPSSKRTISNRTTSGLSLVQMLQQTRSVSSAINLAAAVEDPFTRLDRSPQHSRHASLTFKNSRAAAPASALKTPFSAWNIAASHALAGSLMESPPATDHDAAGKPHGDEPLTGASLCGQRSPAHLDGSPGPNKENREQLSLQHLLDLPLFQGVVAATTQRLQKSRSSIVHSGGDNHNHTSHKDDDQGSTHEGEQEEVNESKAGLSLALGWTWLDFLLAAYPETSPPALTNDSTTVAPRSHSRLLFAHKLQILHTVVPVMKGLRVRMGIHSGVSADEILLNKDTHRQQYTGRALTFAKAIADAAQGGMVLMSAAAFEQHKQSTVKAAHGSSAAIVVYMGQHDLGLGQHVAETGWPLQRPEVAEASATGRSWRHLIRQQLQRARGLIYTGERDGDGASVRAATSSQQQQGNGPSDRAHTVPGRSNNHDTPPQPGTSAPAAGAAVPVDQGPPAGGRVLQHQTSRNNNASPLSVAPRQGSGAVLQRQSSASALQRQASYRQAQMIASASASAGNGQALQPPPPAQPAAGGSSRHGSHFLARSSSTQAPPPGLRLEVASSAAHELYMATPVALQARLGHLGAVRSKAKLLPGALSAPMPAAAIAFMHAYGASILLADMPGPARAAMCIFSKCVLQQLALAGGFLVESTDGFVLAAFTHPAPAIAWALACNDELNHQAWPEEILDNDLGREVLQLAPRADAGERRQTQQSDRQSSTGPYNATAGEEPQMFTAAQHRELDSSSSHLPSSMPTLAPSAPMSASDTPTASAVPASVERTRGSVDQSGHGCSSGSLRTLNSHSTAVVVARGIRARCGIDVGVIMPELHPTTGRMDYRGRVTNRAARIAAKAPAGQVLASALAWSLSEEHDAVTGAGVCAHALGSFELKGVPEPLELVSCTRTAARHPV